MAAEQHPPATLSADLKKAGSGLTKQAGSTPPGTALQAQAEQHEQRSAHSRANRR